MSWIKLSKETMPPDGQLVTFLHHINGEEKQSFGKYNVQNNEFMALDYSTDTY